MQLHETIREIIEHKEAVNHFPTHALFFADLLTSGQDQEVLKKELRDLARSSKIHIGNTINDYYITLKS